MPSTCPCCRWCHHPSVALFNDLCRSCLEGLPCDDCGCAVPVQVYLGSMDAHAVCHACWPQRTQTFGVPLTKDISHDSHRPGKRSGVETCQRRGSS